MMEDEDSIEPAGQQNDLEVYHDQPPYHSRQLKDIWSRHDQGDEHHRQEEEDPLTRDEESSVKEVTFVLNGKQERFVIANEVEASVDQFPDDEDFDFSI